jgi:hypothetical protein
MNGSDRLLVNCLKLTKSFCRPIGSLNRELHGYRILVILVAAATDNQVPRVIATP